MLMIQLPIESLLIGTIIIQKPMNLHTKNSSLLCIENQLLTLKTLIKKLVTVEFVNEVLSDIQILSIVHDLMTI